MAGGGGGQVLPGGLGSARLGSAPQRSAMTVTRLDQGQRYRPRMAFLKKVSSQPAWQRWDLRRARIKPCRDMRCHVVTCHAIS